LRNVPLGQVCEINPQKTAKINPELQCSFIPMEYVDDQFGIVTKQGIRQVKEVDKGYTFFQSNDILFAKITPCMENGKCAITKNLINGIGFGSTEFHVVRAKIDVLPQWVYYYLRQASTREMAEICMTGSAGQKRVPTSFLEKTLIPFPSLPEQKRIAAILEKADRLRRLRRYALELSGTYLQTVFLEMFGDPSKNPKNWPTDYLYQLCSKVVDCPHSTPIYTSTPTAYACVRSSDIQDGFLDWSTTKYIDYQEYQKRIHNHVPMPNEIVYCREGARFGNAAIIPDGKKVCLGQRMMLFRAAPDVATPAFIWAFLESESTRKQADGIVGGSASPHLNVGDIKEFIAIIPPLPLQQKFAQIVQKYERLRTQQREAERQAEHLFQTLLHQAFQGELSLDEDEVLMPDVEVTHQRMPAFTDVIESINTDAYQLALPME
jgi:type I restriction enzyme, S subunit